jgi:hypothetical protein
MGLESASNINHPGDHMPFITRQVAAVAAALSLSAGPALASSATSSTDAVKAQTPLTAKIAKETPLIRLGYTLNNGVDRVLEPNAVASDDAALVVSRIHASSAQRPAKLEWVLGADIQRRADNTIAYGQHEQVYNHPARGKRLVDAGLAYLRLSNYFIANADSLLGVPHPQYTAEPYQPYKNRPVKITTRLIAKAPKRTLAAMIAMGTPLLRQTIPDHILSTFVRLNQAAADYYSVVVGRMHVDRAQHSAQQEWVDGTRALGRGDEQLSDGIESVSIIPIRAAARREIQSGVTTFRHADSQISHADALLGVHQSGPTVTFPTKVVYKF